MYVEAEECSVHVELQYCSVRVVCTTAACTKNSVSAPKDRQLIPPPLFVNPHHLVSLHLQVVWDESRARQADEN